MSEEIVVADNPEASRYEITVDGKPAGFAAYRLRPGKIIFTHTEIDSSFEGRGLGGRLASGALDGARAAGLAVGPICPFFVRYIQRHPEYQDLVAEDYREAVEKTG
ncbi:N-acetyltransferase [Microtetraspora sp. NBRC 13810]|uniref:GNAT family N-acetyltransferase n=1 Tax=Microtetraspora sp. NBRC 13810 TaxID=3030990 RepID=UPI0024A4A69A|nr:GNAT family N-acetyltransferase [Microtetraspora sp. NBRC 13810]GLW07346.1 N-acetyltransferase [Microtetraspora sp. NBRC 13810]